MSNQNQSHHAKVGQAVQAATVDNAKAIRASLLSACAQFAKADTALANATEGRKGAYTSTMDAAIAAGSREPFETVCNQVFADLRANVDGIAKKAGLKLGKGKKGQSPAYLIPGGLSSAKSVILAAFDRKISLTVTEDGETSPRKFREVRDDVKSAQDVETVAQLAGRDKSIYLVREMASKVANAADAYTEAELPKVLETLTALVKIASGAIARQEAEASKGADLADSKTAATKAA